MKTDRLAPIKRAAAAVTGAALGRIVAGSAPSDENPKFNHIQMNRQTTAKVALLTLAGLALVAGFANPAAAQDSGVENDISCTDEPVNIAHIAYSDVSLWDLWTQASEYADAAIDKCGLDSREQTELGGEIRAHVIGAPTPYPGPTIDMANLGDPQEDVFEYLMYF